MNRKVRRLYYTLQMEDNTPPRDIEHVPFRRQDRRILNSRKKRVMDRKLIRCILLTGLLMVAAGAALIALWWMYEDGEYSASFPIGFY